MNFGLRLTAGRAALCAVLFGGLLFLPSRSYELFPSPPTQVNPSREGMNVSGSAALKYLDPSPGELSGVMQILNVSESLSFDYPFDAVADATLSQHTLEGVWWKRDPGVRGFVSLANVTDMTKEVTYL